MLTIQRTNDAGAVLETVEIPALLEAAGGAAIDAYLDADSPARVAQLEALRTVEAARVAAQEQAWRDAHQAPPAAPTTPSSDDSPAARRRRDRPTASQE